MEIQGQCHAQGASQVILMVKNTPANARDIKDSVSIPASGRSLEEGTATHLKYSCLENPMDRRAWQAHRGHGSSVSLPLYLLYASLPSGCS